MSLLAIDHCLSAAGYMLFVAGAGFLGLRTVVEGMVRGQRAKEIQTESFGGIFGFTDVARGGVHVAFSFDGRSFDGGNPSRDLTAAGCSHVSNLFHLACGGSELGPQLDDGKHGSDFSGRASRNGKEHEQLVGCHSLESLRDVVRDRQRSPIELVPESPGYRSLVSLKEIQNPIVERGSFPPCRKIFKLMVVCHDGLSGEIDDRR